MFAGERTQHPGWGYCKMHGGNTPNGIKHAARLRWEAMKAAAEQSGFYHGLVKDVTAEQVLLDEVRRSSAIVTWLQYMISQWRIEPETPEEELARLEADDPDSPATGAELLQMMNVSRSTGLPALGAVVTWEKGGTIAPTEVQAWLRMYLDERQQAVRSAKAAIDAGVADRLVKLAEREVDVLVDVIRASLADMGLELTPERVAIVGRHMRAIGGRVAS